MNQFSTAKSDSVKKVARGDLRWLSQWSNEGPFASLLVCRGALWLTSRKSGQEIVLEPGQLWSWDGREDWLVEGLTDASIELCPVLETGFAPHERRAKIA